MSKKKKLELKVQRKKFYFERIANQIPSVCSSDVVEQKSVYGKTSC